MVNFSEINESAYVLRVSRFTGYFCGEKFCDLSIVNGTAVYFLKSLDPDQGRRWHRIHDPGADPEPHKTNADPKHYCKRKNAPSFLFDA